MSSRKRILVVERDAQARARLACALRASGHATVEAGTGREALRSVQMEKPDLCVIGVALPDIVGRDLARILESGDHGENVKTMLASGPGAPCDDRRDDPGEHRVLRWAHVDEVVTLVNTMLDAGADVDASTLACPMTAGPLRIDPGRLTAVVDGKSVCLTRRECRFLQVLALNAERTCTRDEIRRLVWDESEDVIGRTVDVLVSRLRGKLHAATGREVVETVRGIGYRLCGAPDSPAVDCERRSPTDTR
jgi:DNA-binding response OmpR family regulator